MSKLNEYSFKSSNGRNEIYVREWLPDTKPLGVIQIVHGVAEHTKRYDEFARFLSSMGYVVAGNDHLGHGQSIGNPQEKGYFSAHGGWELVVGDVRRLRDILKERFPDVPHFIFGHSMGSFITRTYMIRYHDDPDGVILSGTGQQPSLIVSLGISLANREIRKKGPSYYSESMNKIAFGSYNKKIKNPISDYDWVSNNPECLQEYLDDPLCGFIPSVGLFRDMFTGIKYISNAKNVAQVSKDLPVLLVSGAEDPVGDYGKGVVKAYKAYVKAGLKDVTLKMYPGSRHELVGDLHRKNVYEDILAWLTAHGQDPLKA